MFWPYWLSVLIVALAIYGLWHLWSQLAAAAIHPDRQRQLAVSLLIVVRNTENTVEGSIRYLIQQAELEARWQEIVVIDNGSEDLTPAILVRLAEANPLVTAVFLPAAARPLAEGLAYCRGEIIEVLDLVNRLPARDLVPAARLLLRK